MDIGHIRESLPRLEFSGDLNPELLYTLPSTAGKKSEVPTLRVLISIISQIPDG